MLSISNLNSCSCQRTQYLKCLVFRSYSLLQFNTCSVQTWLVLQSSLQRQASFLHLPACPPNNNCLQINMRSLDYVLLSLLWERNKTWIRVSFLCALPAWTACCVPCLCTGRDLPVAGRLTSLGLWRKLANLTCPTHLRRNNSVSRDCTVARIMILYSAFWDFPAPWGNRG